MYILLKVYIAPDLRLINLLTPILIYGSSKNIIKFLSFKIKHQYHAECVFQ